MFFTFAMKLLVTFLLKWTDLKLILAFDYKTELTAVRDHALFVPFRLLRK